MAAEPSGLTDFDPESLPQVPAPVLSLKEIDHGAAARLASDLAIEPVLAAVLVARGLGNPDDARAWLAAERPAGRLSEGVDAVASVIAAAIGSGTAIAVHGDYDCDGVCSTSVLTLGLRALGGSVVARIPEREDGYGLSSGAVEELAAGGARVLIAVDCGVTSVDEVDHARSLGLDVCIVDHHRPRADGRLPDAAIAHPDLTGLGRLPMCATSVAVEVIEAAAELLGVELPELGFAELRALATVTDVMPLEGANRSFVKEGLASLAVTGRPGLSALMDVAGIDRTALTSRTLGFGLGPRINASGRVRSASAALELMLTEDRDRATQLASMLDAANVERRELQKRTRLEAEYLLRGRDGDAGWVIAKEGWHPGVVGIVAGAVSGKWHRPTVVLAIDGETATGSARSVPGFDVAAVLDSCSPLLLRHGGHAAAAGLTIETERIPEFTRMFAELVEQSIEPGMRTPIVTADVAVAPAELTLELAEQLEAIEPTGNGNPEPVLLLRNVTCERPRRMGDGRHARFSVVGGAGTSDAVAFETRERLAVGWGDRADLVGRLEVNRFRGATSPRLVVERATEAKRPVLRVVGGDGDWLDSLKAAFDPGLPSPGGKQTRALGATARNLLGLLSALEPSGSVALVAADASRRVDGLREAAATCDLFDWSMVECRPGLLEPYDHVVIVDPPWNIDLLSLAGATGSGWIHHAWSDAELRFTLKVHEAANDIEGRIRPFYAELRDAADRGPEAVLTSLRGSGRRPRPAKQVAWMLRTLDEIGAVRVDLATLELSISEPTGSLDSSAVLAESKLRLEEGRRFLTGLNPGTA